MFEKYMHVERFGTEETSGIENGFCYIFPKLDGTNASAWLHEGVIRGGSRNRELSLSNDNAGFLSWLMDQDNIKELLFKFPHWILYGEWLVPHTLKTYRASAWRRFHVFDVYDTKERKYLEYSNYAQHLSQYKVDCVPPIDIVGISAEEFPQYLDKNTFLIEDGKGIGEGIVIKNYNYKNKFGRTVWAKILAPEFHKAKEEKSSGKWGDAIESKIAEKYITKHLVDKTFSKVTNENSGWSSKYIPQLLSRVYHDLITEEMWDILKKFKSPAIDFKALNSCVTAKIKELSPELF